MVSCTAVRFATWWESMRARSHGNTLQDSGSRRSWDRLGSSLLLVVIVTSVLLHRVIVSPTPNMAQVAARSSQPVAVAAGPAQSEILHVPPMLPVPAQGSLATPSTPAVPVGTPPAAHGTSANTSPHRRGGDNQHVEVPTPVPLSPDELATYKPNELGQIPVLMYHAFTTNPDYLDDWTRTPDGFREDLQWLADHDFFLIGMGDVLRNEIAVPAGKHPVVLTFDDSSSGQFRLLEDETGERYPDPTTAVGVMEAFFTEHPDVGRGAHFAFVPNNCFRYHEEVTTCEERVTWLAAHGYEIGNHTWYHQNLGEADDERFMSQIGDTKLWIDEHVSGRANQSDVLTLPFGALPATEWQFSMLVNGFDWQGQRIQMGAILLVGGGPSVSPDSATWNPWAITRFNTDEATLGHWKEQIETGAITMYTSDGNPASVAIPDELPEDLAGQFDPGGLASRGRSLLRYGAVPAGEDAGLDAHRDGFEADRRAISRRSEPHRSDPFAGRGPMQEVHSG